MLASYFKGNVTGDMSRKVWVELPEAVGISRNEIDVTCHGFVKQMPTAERARVFSAACNIIDKFIVLGRVWI
ncbi:MAG: hypothetical protein COB33_014980 [Thiotrichaceae bacterium]|nr:hypothetical protein [Thiotrichaceae bacterium]